MIRKIYFKPIFFDLETTGLDSFEHEIIAIGFGFLEGDIKVIQKSSEREILLEFIDFLNKNKKSNLLLVGYNIESFDMPFLLARGVHNGIKEAAIVKEFFTLDLFKVVLKYISSNAQPNNQKRKLKNVANLLGIEIFDEIDGYEIPQLFRNSDFEKIKEHCESDVRLARESFIRLKEFCRLYLKEVYYINADFV